MRCELSFMLGCMLAAASLANDVVFNELPDSVDVLEVTQSISVNGLITPVAVRYVKTSDLAPSCAILVKGGNDKYVELVSPENGKNLPACGRPLIKPVAFSVKGAAYALYEYSIEDPVKYFTQSWQLIRLGENGGIICRNDEQLMSYAEKVKGRRPMYRAIESAIEKLGCIVD